MVEGIYYHSVKLKLFLILLLNKIYDTKVGPTL